MNLYPLFVVGYLCAAVAVFAADPFFVKALRLIAFDSYQRLAPLPEKPFPVRIVDIDERSLALVGQWPWPRTTMADLLDQLRANGAASVAFDIMFPEPDRTSLEQVTKGLPKDRAAELVPIVSKWTSNDTVFADAVRSAPTVLAVTLTPNGGFDGSAFHAKAGFAVAGDDAVPFLKGFDRFAGNLPALTDVASGIGSINWFPDRDGVVRRVPLIFRVGNQIVPSLASEALRLAQGASSYVIKSSNASGETAYGQKTGVNHIRIGALEVPTDADGAIWLRYRHSDPAKFIPAWKVLQHKITPADVQGTIILVGTSAAGLEDLRSTPLDAAIPGVEIHEQLIEHILSGQFLTRPDYAHALEITLMLLAGVGLAIVFPRVSAGTAALFGGAAIATFILGGWAAFRYEGMLFDSLYPSVSTLLFVAGATFYLYRRTERQRAEIRRAFGQYVAPEVVSHLVQNPDRLVLGGEERELTLLFCDVRNYTNISEGLTAEELTTFINELLTPMTDIIMARMGTIDKYMGDAIMAFWNAPLDVADHATRACDAALAMKRELVTLNEHWKVSAERKGRPYREVALGIGINTGVCCVGNLGSTQRFDYSAIGDNVNMASRFEGLTKFYGLPLVTGEETVKRGGGLPFLEVDLVRVKGKDRPSRIYTLLNLLDVDDERTEPLVAAHQQMLASYREADWAGAQNALVECRSFEIAGLHKLYEMYEQRLSRYRLAPPPKDWSAVHVHEEK